MGTNDNVKIEPPRDVSFIISELEGKGYEAYAVGGCIRDSLLGKTPDDWDITTSASPEEVKAVFQRTIDTGIKHGTVTVRLHGRSYEVTTFRIDGDYSDGRHPDNVEFVKNLDEDLKRRDFTINAMAYSEKAGIIDLFNGREDLEKGIIRCVGVSRERFSEDALRMMRAVRFAARFGFSIEESTYEAIKDLAPTLSKVSAERIRVEFEKTLILDHPEFAREFYLLGLSKVFLPEWDACLECPQNTVHHLYTVGEHTIRVMQNVSNDHIMRLAAFFHDIGKPVSRKTDKKGHDHFVGHPVLGAAMTVNIMKRLKYDNATIDKVRVLVERHDDRPALTIENIRHEISGTGKEIYPLLLELRHADVMGQSDFHREEKLNRVSESRRYFDEICSENDALSVRDLAIKGRDLIEMGIEKGPSMGIIFDELLAIVLKNPELNERDSLISLTKSIINVIKHGEPFVYEGCK